MCCTKISFKILLIRNLNEKDIRSREYPNECARLNSIFSHDDKLVKIESIKWSILFENFMDNYFLEKIVEKLTHARVLPNMHLNR